MAKKVNTKFLVILTAVLGVFAVVAFVAVVLSHHDAKYCIRQAEKEVERGNLTAAADWYGKAISKDRTNKETYVKLGDVYSRLVTQDPTYLGKAQGAWRGALGVDPGYRPALDRLLDLYVQETKAGDDPAVFVELRKIAEQALLADPTNATDESYIHIAPLQQWLHGAAFPDKTVDEHIRALAALAQKHPADADIAFYASQAQLKRARNLMTSGNPDQAHALFDQVAARHAELVKGQPHAAAVQMYAYEVFGALRDMDDRADRRPGYQDLRRQAIAAAESAAKPSDDEYGDIQHLYANWLLSQGKPRADAEQVYRDWVKAKPSDQRARIELAEFLGQSPAQRPEAIEILSKPVPPDPNLAGFAALRVRAYDRGALVDLNSLRVEDARAAKGDERTALIAKIDADLARIAGSGFGEDFSYLKLRGKVEMLHGTPVEAVKTFERARTLLGGGFDSDLWTNLEQAYLSTGQLGSAQRVIEDVVARMPYSVPARMALAELYLNTDQTEHAAQQIDKLKALSAGRPEVADEVARLRIALLNQQNRPDEARQQLALLPEKTRAQQMSKAQLAAASADSAEAVRLFDLVLQDTPGDPDAVRGLVDLYLRQGSKEQAQQVVASALRAKPNEQGLIMLRDRLAVSTPEQLRKWQDEVTNQLTDPYARAVHRAQLALDRKEFDEAARQLDAADKLKPNGSQAAELRYQWFMRQNRLDDAALFVDRAAHANVDRMDGLALRTRFALDRHDPAEALKWGNELVGKHGEFAENWVLLGGAQQASGHYRDAIRSYDLALSRQPTNLDALRSKAQCLESLGQFTEEKSVIDLAARSFPDNVMIRDMSANFELHHGDPEKVVTLCQELLQHDSGSARLYGALGQAYAVTGLVKYAKDPAKSREFLTRSKDVLTEAMTKFAAAPEARGFYPLLATDLEHLGDFAGAEKVLRDFAALPAEKDDPGPMRNLAQFYERNRRPEQAEQAYSEAYAKSGHDVNAELDLAGFLMRRGRMNDALKVLEANTSDRRVIDQRTEALLNAGRFQDAMKLVSDVLSKNAIDVTALSYRGLIELAQGDAAAATKDFTYLRDKDPNNVQYRLWLARALLAGDRRNDAIGELEAALSRAPLRSDVRLLLLDAYSSGTSPRWDDFDRVVQDAQANPALSSDPTWHQIYARGLTRRKLFDLALQEIQSARKMAPNNRELQYDYVNILIDSKNWQAAVQAADKEISEGFKDAAVYQQRGTAKAGLGDKAGALQDFDASLAAAEAAHDMNRVNDVLHSIARVIDADEALARLDKLPAGPERELVAMELHAIKHDWAGEVQAAEAVIALGDKLTPDQRVLALRGSGDGYMNLHQFEKACQAYEGLLKLKPDDLSALNNVAYVLAENLKKPQEAKSYSTRAYDLAQRQGGLPDVSDTHGWVLTLCGGRDAMAGTGILQKVVESNEKFTKARYHLVQAYLQEGRFEDAQRQLAVVQDQINQLQQNHQPVDDEIQAGIQQASEQIRAKLGPKGQASSR